MKESRAFHPTVIKAVLFTNIPFLLYLLVVSSWPARIVLLFVVGAALAYSIKGLRFKEIPLLDSLTSSFHFVGPLLYGIVLIGFIPQAWPWLIAFFLWGMASHAFGAVQDIIPDRKGGIHSIATAFGAPLTVRFSFVLYLIAASIVYVQGSVYLPVALMGIAYAINIAPYLLTTDKTSNRTNAAWKRFLWFNYASGAVVTLVIIATHI